MTRLAQSALEPNPTEIPAICLELLSDGLGAPCRQAVFGGFHGLKKTHVLTKNGGFFSEIIGLSSRSNVCALRAKNPRCAKPCRARCLILIFFIICLALTEGKKWWKYSSLLALRVQRRRSLWLIEENVVGVTEFNSSRRRLERSACEGGEGDAGVCAEPRNSCGQRGRRRRQSCHVLQ